MAVFILFLLVIANASAADIYACNQNGKTIYTDQPCEGHKVELKPTNLSNAVDISEYNSPVWYTDSLGYKKALEVSKQYDAPIFIYFQADWCRYCRKLERELLHTFEGKNILSKVVKVQISPESGHNEKALFDYFGGTGYPSVYIKKSSQSAHKKYSFMNKKSNSWETSPINKLRMAIDSVLH